MKTNCVHQYFHFSDLLPFFKKPKQNSFSLENLIEEQKITIQNLQISYQKALKENFHKTEFLSSIAHELKNQIGGIISLSEFIKSESCGKIENPEYLEFASDINNVAQELLEFTCDLVDVNQMDSGEFSVNLAKEIDVADVIKKSIKINYGLALKRSIKIEFKRDQSVIPKINLDQRRLKQILVNLISNALKYSNEGSSIQISVKKNSENYLEISVKDEGFGMSPDDIEIALKKYQRIQNKNFDKFESFGLGLPLVKKLVELQKGEMKIQSELQKGTEIILKFPYLMKYAQTVSRY